MLIIKTGSITIGVLIPIIVFILWLISRTQKVEAHVIDASMNQFHLTDDSQLLFNLSVDMTLKNPGLAFQFFFDSIEVAVLYQDINLSNMSLSPFYQGKDARKLLKLKFDGQQLVKLNAEQLALFTLEKIAELFSVELELRLQTRVKIGPIKFKFKPQVRCGIKVPFISRGSSLLRFRIIGCNVAY